MPTNVFHPGHSFISPNNKPSNTFYQHYQRAFQNCDVCMRAFPLLPSAFFHFIIYLLAHAPTFSITQAEMLAAQDNILVVSLSTSPRELDLFTFPERKQKSVTYRMKRKLLYA